jgi:hypothetical protein
MNALLRGCIHAQSAYFGSFVSTAAPACLGRNAAVVCEIKQCLPTSIVESCWIKRDSSEEKRALR